MNSQIPIVDTQKILEWVKGTTLFSTSDLKISSITKDAGHRHYFRISDGEKSYALMSQGSFEHLGQKLPFLAMTEIMHENGLPVPQVHQLDEDFGFIVISDLGDLWLLDILNNSITFNEHKLLCGQAIDLVSKIHSITDVSPGALGAPCFSKAFDLKKLMWEVNFGIEHYLIGLLGWGAEDQKVKNFRQCYEEICRRLSDRPRVLCHRDFHSKNLMVVENSGNANLWIIDYQDAMMGPRQYDLASFLYDSYFKMDDAVRSEMIKRYIETNSDKIEESSDEFNYYLRLMGLQRNFKAIGSFASFKCLKQNEDYIPFIAPSLEYIDSHLDAVDEFKELKEIFSEIGNI